MSLESPSRSRWSGRCRSIPDLGRDTDDRPSSLMQKRRYPARSLWTCQVQLAAAWLLESALTIGLQPAASLRLKISAVEGSASL